MKNMQQKSGRAELRYSYRHVLGTGQDDMQRSVQHAVDFDVYYSLGGVNHFQGTNEPRGVWFSVSPIEVGEHFVSHKLMASSSMSGLRAFVVGAKRRNDRQLAKVAEAVDELVVAICTLWKDDHEMAKGLFRQAVDEVRRHLGVTTVARTVPADMKDLRKGRMVLVTDEIRARIPPLGSTSGLLEERVVHAKFFRGAWTWWALEGQPEGEDFRFYGYVEGIESEYGEFTLSELESINAPAVERDKFFRPAPMRDVKALAGAF